MSAERLFGIVLILVSVMLMVTSGVTLVAAAALRACR